MDKALYELAEKAGRTLSDRGLMLVTAESCTGGWIAEAVTAVPGSSGWFERGFVTYTYISKREMLGVRGDTLEQHGAVSEAVVLEMVSGVAGPSGGTPEKPVGTVCFAWGMKDRAPRAETRHFPGDREAVRRASVIRALEVMIELIE